MSFVYFDHNATTPVDPRVLEAMLPYLGNQYGNASSRHAAGRQARQAVERAREQVAAAVNAEPARVIFTAGGTEANNLALKGLAATMTPGRLVVSPIEHPSVRVPAHELSWSGWQLRTLRVDASGRVDLADVRAALDEPAGLVSVMMANNETGVIQETAAIRELAHQAGALMHADGVQAMGKIAVDFRALGVDAMTIAGHKINAPKGIGALILGAGVDVMPIITGGSHEKGLRAGTENVPGIVGLGVACELAVRELAAGQEKLLQMRTATEQVLKGLGAVIFGEGAPRVPNTIYFALKGFDSAFMVDALDAAGFGVATGSACASGKTEPSEILAAMGVEPDLARCAVRLSFGKSNRLEDVEAFGRALAQIAAQPQRARA